MAVRRFAMTVANSTRLGADSAVNVTKSSPGGSLTGSNFIELNIEDTLGSRLELLRALDSIKALVLNDTYPPA